MTELFSKVIADGGDKHEQLFNAYKTALFLKRMSSKTFTFRIEMSTRGFKASNVGVTVQLCSYESVTCLIKTLMLYRSLSLRTLKYPNKDNP